VRELSSPRVDQSARCPVRELAIRELSSCQYSTLVPLPVITTGPNHVTGGWGRGSLNISCTFHYVPRDSKEQYNADCLARGGVVRHSVPVSVLHLSYEDCYSQH